MADSWFDLNGGDAAPRSTMPVGTPQRLDVPGVAPSAGQDHHQTFLRIMGGLPATPENLVAKEAELKQAGIEVRRNAEGVAGKIGIIGQPDQIYDVITNAMGGGGGSFKWDYAPPGSGSGPTGIPGGSPGPGVNYGARQGALEKTPGYQFRFDQGMKALGNSAAAKGTLLTGGAAKDAMEFGQGLASTEFDNEYRRLFGMAGLGQGAAGAMGGYGSSYANNATGLITGAGNAQAAGTVGAGNAWNSALGGIGQNAMDAWMWDKYMNKPTGTAPTGPTAPPTGSFWTGSGGGGLS